jgi:plastocyanin
MYVKNRLERRYVTACTFLLGTLPALAATELSVTVRQSNGAPVAGVVVDVQPLAAASPAKTGARAKMDQRNLMFLPDTLVVRSGTTVDFPNSDAVRHQVYSFSPTKKFQLSLYGADERASVLFDKPGLVAVGCNIHDGMIGYIYVTDSPWFGLTGTDGSLNVGSLPAGQYTLKIWHSRIRDRADTLTQSVTLNAASQHVEVTLRQPLKVLQHNHGSDRKWEDY